MKKSCTCPSCWCSERIFLLAHPLKPQMLFCFLHEAKAHFFCLPTLTHSEWSCNLQMQWTHSESKMIIRWYSYPATGKFEHMKCVVADNAYGTDAFNREPGKKQKKGIFFIYFCVIHLMSQWTCHVAIFWRLWELASWPWKKDNLGMKRTPGRYHFSLIFHLLELIYSKFNSPSSAKVNTFSFQTWARVPDCFPSLPQGHNV